MAIKCLNCGCDLTITKNPERYIDENIKQVKSDISKLNKKLSEFKNTTKEERITNKEIISKTKEEYRELLELLSDLKQYKEELKYKVKKEEEKENAQLFLEMADEILSKEQMQKIWKLVKKMKTGVNFRELMSHPNKKAFSEIL